MTLFFQRVHDQVKYPGQLGTKSVVTQFKKYLSFQGAVHDLELFPGLLALYSEFSESLGDPGNWGWTCGLLGIAPGLPEETKFDSERDVTFCGRA